MRKALSVLFKRVLPFFLLFLVVAVSALFWGRSVIRDHYSAMQTRVGDNVVDIAEYVNIGGIPQWVKIRGQDKNNPILLYLHGGPGSAISGLSYSFQYPWEDHFTVVHWDQRGAGRSIPETGLSVESMTIERMLFDTIELIEHLRTQFDQDKVFIIGTSWGTVLGSLVAKRRPDLLHAYIGIGQLVSWQENFEETRQLLVKYAREHGDIEISDKLIAAGPMPEPADAEAYEQWIETVQSPLSGYGKIWRNQPGSAAPRMILTALLSPDLTLSDIWNIRGEVSKKYVLSLLQDLHDFDVRSTGNKFDVPVILIMGKHDWVTPVTLVRDYFQNIQAPYKKYVEMENSAHMVQYDEPGKLFSVLIEEALPFALPRMNSKSE